MNCGLSEGRITCECHNWPLSKRLDCVESRQMRIRAEWIAGLSSDAARKRELALLRLRSVQMAEKVREMAWTLIQENPGKQPPISNPNPQSRLFSVRKRTEAA